MSKITFQGWRLRSGKIVRSAVVKDANGNNFTIYAKQHEAAALRKYLGVNGTPYRGRMTPTYARSTRSR